MASENGDPFDGLSPSASHMQEADTYDDLLGVQVPFEDFDLPMPDFQEEHPQLLHTPPIADMINQQVQNSNRAAERQYLRPTVMELCNDDTNLAETNVDITNKLESTATVPQQSEETASTELDHMSAVMSGNPASHDTDPAEVQASRPKKKTFTIKKEALDVPFTSGIAMNTLDDPVEISDTEDPDSIYKHGTKMSDGVIILSDEEDHEEVIVFDDGSTSVAIKKENPDVELLGATRGLVEVSDSENDEPSIAPDPKLGKSFLRTLKPRAKRTAADIQRMQQIQRLFAEKSLNRNLGPGAGVPLATPKVLQSAGLGSPSHSSNDAFAWMNEVGSLDDDTATDFRVLEKVYKAQRKARQNTLEDDVQFKKAQNEENQRLKRLAQESADTDSGDEAEESDDGLFIPQQSSFHSKRPFSSMMDIIDDDDDDDEEVVPIEPPNPKKPKPAKADLSTKKSRAKARQKELRCNMLAGIEAHLLRDQKRIEDKAAKTAEVEELRTGGKKASNKAKAPDISAKRTKTGRMNNVRSLLTSNIYEDSNANLDRQALPVITEKKKKEFMSSLIANIPPEDKKQANSDRIDILNASRLLGSWKVVPDGQGNWTFKGMKSSLYHYQVCGAACMRVRETGEQHPYGGILADEMGLGKTVQ